MNKALLMRGDLPVIDKLDRVLGFIEAIDKKHLNDEFIKKMHKWRQENRQWYMTEFKPDVEKTRSWIIKELIENDKRLFFLVKDIKHDLVGHYGVRDIFRGEAQLDNPLNGEQTGEKGLFTCVGITLMDIVFKEKNVDCFYVQAFSNNEKSIILHERMGMTYAASFFLKRVIVDENTVEHVIVNSVIESNVDYRYNKYMITKEEFYRKNAYMIGREYNCF